MYFPSVCEDGGIFVLVPEKNLRAAPYQIPPIRYPYQSDNFSNRNTSYIRVKYKNTLPEYLFFVYPTFTLRYCRHMVGTFSIVNNLRRKKR